MIYIRAKSNQKLILNTSDNRCYKLADASWTKLTFSYVEMPNSTSSATEQSSTIFFLNCFPDYVPHPSETSFYQIIAVQEVIIFTTQEVLLAFSRNITGHPSPPDMMACSMWKHTIVEFISFSCTLLKNKVTSYSYLKILPSFLISTYIKSYLDNSRSERTFYMFLKGSRKAAQEFCGIA